MKNRSCCERFFFVSVSDEEDVMEMQQEYRRNSNAIMSFYNSNRLHKINIVLINVFQKDDHSSIFNNVQLGQSTQGWGGGR